MEKIFCPALWEEISKSECRPKPDSECHGCFHSLSLAEQKAIRANKALATHSIPKSIKLDPFDRVQAFKHSKKYAEDYRKYVEERGDAQDVILGPPNAYQTKLSEPAKRLCKKWGLRYPLNPDSPVHELDFQCVHAPVNFLDPPESWETFRAYSWRDKPEEKTITHVNGKLVLMIDTAYPRNQIEEAIGKFLDRYAEKPDRRIHKQPDIWEIYQKHKIEGTPLLQITRELHGIEKNKYPSYDKQTDALYRQVQRAYEKACRIIKTIEESVSP